MISQIIILIFMLLCCAKGEEKPEFLNLPEGSKCSKNGVNGVCASVYNCLNAAEDIKHEDYPSICSYRGKTEIICCTDCELVNDTRNMFISPTSGNWYWRNGQKARDKCIDYMQQLQPCHGHFIGTIHKDLDKKRNCFIPRPTAVGAVGGEDAKRDEFPHMALLGYGPDENAAYWICGGSLISENFVLTAGHCTNTSVGFVKYIALGILKRTDPVELWQRYKVKRIINHPEYKKPSKYNDIALLETQGRVKFNIHVMPACIHFERDENDNMAQATGWGALGLGRELADTLQAVYLEEFSTEECAKLYPRLADQLEHGFDHKTQMCYGNHKEIKDTCQGDSGGPLHNKFHISGCQFTVLGVTSTGRQCGKIGSTGLYTNLDYYRSWIEEHVWP